MPPFSNIVSRFLASACLADWRDVFPAWRRTSVNGSWLYRYLCGCRCHHYITNTWQFQAPPKELHYLRPGVSRPECFACKSSKCYTGEEESHTLQPARPKA